MRESLERAQVNYQKKCKVITIRFNKETEADLIRWLEDHEGQAGTLIKEMIKKELT